MRVRVRERGRVRGDVVGTRRDADAARDDEPHVRVRLGRAHERVARRERALPLGRTNEPQELHVRERLREVIAEEGLQAARGRAELRSALVLNDVGAHRKKEKSH